MYKTEVIVVTRPVAEWMAEYCRPEIFVEACKGCPDYGRLWSCPPGAPTAYALLDGRRYVHLIGVKVIYDEATRRAADSPEAVERLRQASYGQVKLALLESQLALERALPGSISIAAGRCEQCPSCTRESGLPCRKPERMRYSFSGLGFDLGRIAEELLGMPLLWSNEGLPLYNVAIAAVAE